MSQVRGFEDKTFLRANRTQKFMKAHQNVVVPPPHEEKTAVRELLINVTFVTKKTTRCCHAPALDPSSWLAWGMLKMNYRISNKEVVKIHLWEQ